MTSAQYGPELWWLRYRRRNDLNRYRQDVDAMFMHSICNDATFQKNFDEGQPRNVTDKTIDKIEELLAASGGNLVYAGYPYDPFMLDAAKHRDVVCQKVTPKQTPLSSARRDR